MCSAKLTYALSSLQLTLSSVPNLNYDDIKGAEKADTYRNGTDIMDLGALPLTDFSGHIPATAVPTIEMNRRRVMCLTAIHSSFLKVEISSKPILYRSRFAPRHPRDL